LNGRNKPICLVVPFGTGRTIDYLLATIRRQLPGVWDIVKSFALLVHPSAIRRIMSLIGAEQTSTGRRRRREGSKVIADKIIKTKK